jgi:transcriptional regulator with XRE-family HTH domain
MELARRAGVSPSYVSLIEHGEKIPSENVAVRIAQALDEREDLYRVWAVTSRMDERTREAVLRVSQAGELGEGTTPVSSRPPAIESRAAHRGAALEEEVVAFGLTVPLLVPGATPTNGEIRDEDVETHVTLDARLVAVEPTSDLVALRVDELNGARVRAWLRQDDIVLLEHHSRSLAPGRIHALRVAREGIVLSKVTRDGERLLLLPDPSDDGPPRTMPLAGEGALEETLFGTVVASFRSWS